MAQLQSTSITGSLIVTGGITGSLLGTASFALTSSYALNAGDSVWTGSGGNIYYNGGNVGIGIASPAEKLTVAGNISVTGSYAVYLDGTSAWSAPMLGRDSSTVFLSDFTGVQLGGWNGSSYGPRFTVLGTGNVGIGTTTPAEKLSLVGSTGTTFGLSLEPNGWGSAKHRLTVPTSGDTSMWSFNWNGSAIDASYAPSAITLTQGAVQFYTANSATSPSERMRIDSTGNVGIGFTSPSEKLDVSGSGKFGAYARIGTNISAGYYQDSANGAFRSLSGASNPGFYFQNYGGAATTMYIGLDGTYASKVGIGTTTPGYDLHIARASSENGILTSFGASDIYLSHGGWSMGAGKFGIGDASAPTIAIDATNDRLGVGGTTNPQYLIDAYSTNASTNRISIGGTTNFSLFQAFNSSGTFYLGIDNSAGNGFSQGVYSRILYSSGDYPLVISTNGTEKMRITAGGNVGIGTASPTEVLAVSGNIETVDPYGKIGFNVGDAYGSFPHYGLGKENGGTNLVNLAGFYGVTFGTYGYERIRIDTSGNVGIGTTSPSQPLHVNGRTLVDQFQYTKAINISSGDLNDYTTAGFYNGAGMSNTPNSGWFWITIETFSGDTNWVHQTATSFGSGNTANEVYTRVRAGGTWGAWKKLSDSGDISGTTSYIPKFTGTNSIGNSVMYESSGNIGLSTTSPSAKLHIAANTLGTGSGDYVLNSIHYNSNGNSEDLEIKSVRESTGNDWTFGGKRLQLRIDSTYMGYMQFNGYGNQAGISFGTGTTLTAPGNVTERMRINSSGNVGIGTTSPSQKLEVSGNIFASTGNNGGFILEGGNAILRQAGNSMGFNVSGSERMRINDSGDVGIGTTSPNTKLQVNNSNTYGSVNHQLKLDGTISGGSSSDPAYYGGITITGNGYEWGAIRAIQTNPAASWTSRLAFYTMDGNGGQPAVERMSIDNSGNVGIGTTSPTNRLTVTGGSLILGTESTYALRIINGSGKPLTFGSDTSYSYIQSWSSGPLQINNQGNNTLINVNTGNVGIGTTSPQGKLAVDGGNIYHNYGNASTAYYLYLNHNSSQDGGMLWTRDNSTFDWQVNNLAANGNLSFYNYGTSSPTLTLQKSTGNVGIGVTSPTKKLAVAGNGVSTVLIGDAGFTDYAGISLNGTLDSGNYNILSSPTDTTLFINRPSGNDIRFRENNSTQVTILAGGNVGIGTTNPDFNLTINGMTGIQSSGTTKYHFSYYNGGLNFAETGIADYRLFIKDGGNVGIGTGSPAYKLDVNGNTNINGVLTATVKSFIIDHPTKEGKKLQYGVLEGPEHSVYVRGKLTNTNVIQLPDYWHALVHEDSITVNLTAIGKPQEIWVEEITDTYITVGSSNLNVNCFYTVFAERKDIDKLVTEFDKE